MKKSIKRFLCVMMAALILTSCGNTDSKINQVLQDRIMEEDKNQNESVKKNEADISSEKTEGMKDETVTDGETINVSTAGKDVTIDVDLTLLSSTMVYSEVYNMIYKPEDYLGKTVKMKGMFIVYTNQDQSMFYPAVIIADATACCSQGLEFVLKGNPPFPEGYPEMETEIEVIGTFETYEEEGNIFCRLKDAEIE